MSLEIADDLIARCLDGRATEHDVRRLETHLEQDAAFRRAWLRVARVDALLHRVGHRSDADLVDLTQRHQSRRLQSPSARPRPSMPGLLGNRGLPLVAGLAGIAVGVIGTSLGWASMVRTTAEVATERRASYRQIMSEDFEDGGGPGVTGLPAKPGVWSGDQSELVGVHGDTAPRSGSRMLRFVSGWFDGKPTHDGHSCDVVQLIDLRPYRRQITNGTWAVRITAFFNVSAGSLEGREQCSVAGFVFDAATDISDKTPGSLRDKSLAYACCQRIDLDDDARTWQPATAEFRLPVDSAILAVHCGVSEYSRDTGKPPKHFRGHYCDDVSVTLVRLPDVP